MSAKLFILLVLTVILLVLTVSLLAISSDLAGSWQLVLAIVRDKVLLFPLRFAAMSDAPFTEADVRYLLRARKIIQSVLKDTTSNPDAPLLEIVYRIVRVDNPDDDIKLRLNARRPKPVSVRLPKPKPSTSLQWHGERIRGIDHKLFHDVIKNGMVVGKVRGWHEHQWTLRDGDRRVIDVNEEMKKVQEDFRSILRFCMERWRIELIEKEERQQILKFM